MTEALHAKLDAFALNIAAGETTTETSLGNAFIAAENVGFRLFFSFDYAGNGPWDKADVIDLMTSYAGTSLTYFHHNDQPLCSTFEGPGNAADWTDIKKETGCFFVPDWSSLGAKVAMQQADGVADGLFSWAAWPYGPTDMDTYNDASYYEFLGGKPYIMPVSPWFSPICRAMIRIGCGVGMICGMIAGNRYITWHPNLWRSSHGMTMVNSIISVYLMMFTTS